MLSKKNLPLFIGLLIPVLMIIFIAASIYLPGIFATKPKYDFLYSNGPTYETYYYVDNVTLQKRVYPTPSPYYPSYSPNQALKLYIYRVQTQTSEEISFEEGQRFKLLSDTKSPDGYEIVPGENSGGFFPFFYYSDRDYGARYIKGNGFSKKLNINRGANRYSDSFVFLGWIVQ